MALLYTAGVWLASECLPVAKSALSAMPNAKSPHGSIQKRGGTVGTKTPAFGFINETGDYLKNGSPGRIRTGDLSINSRMLYR